MKVRKFNPSSPHPMRAVQTWQILVGKAMNRQTVTYNELGKLVYGRHAPGVFAKILGHIAFYCEDYKLPSLTTIVVSQGAGAPGFGIPIPPSKVLTEREKVFERDWYDIVPPTADELHEAYMRH
jgi:hypothetical protein